MGMLLFSYVRATAARKGVKLEETQLHGFYRLLAPDSVQIGNGRGLDWTLYTCTRYLDGVLRRVCREATPIFKGPPAALVALHLTLASEPGEDHLVPGFRPEPTTPHFGQRDARVTALALEGIDTGGRRRGGTGGASSSASVLARLGAGYRLARPQGKFACIASKITSDAGRCPFSGWSSM